ncbi:hypothetical protein H9P43_008007 [Blastocladiella emersonii ATCC 22665]|nr:hypothetical protein H9P43_008007 [Blastocladiella emersonii ATCC 22665]
MDAAGHGADPRQPLSHGELDYAALHYAGAPNANLVCPICTLPFLDAESTPCGHTFCAACLRRSLASNAACPACRAECTRDPTPAYVVRSLADELLVLCPNADRGCPATVARAQLPDHARSQCPFRLAACAHCAAQVPAHDLDSHQASCVAARHACPRGCGELLALADADPNIADRMHPRAAALETENATLRFAQANMASTLDAVLERVAALELAAREPPLPPPPPPLSAQVLEHEAVLDRLVAEVDGLRASLARVELRANVELQAESLRLREEMQGLRTFSLNLRSFLTQSSAAAAAAVASSGSGSAARPPKSTTTNQKL